MGVPRIDHLENKGEQLGPDVARWLRCWCGAGRLVGKALSSSSCSSTSSGDVQQQPLGYAHQHHLLLLLLPGQQPGVFFQQETYLLPRKIFPWNSRSVRTCGNIWRRSGEMFAGQCDAAGSGSCTQERGEDRSTLPYFSCKRYNFLMAQM